MTLRARPVTAPPPPTFTRPLSRRIGWRPLVIFALTVMSYASAATSPLLFDDQTSIVSNTSIRRLTPLQGPLSPPRDTPVAGRPIVNLTFAINYATSGLGTRGYHVTNVFIHVFAAWLLLGVVRRGLRLPRVPPLLRDRADDLAFVCALLWALHPLNSEAVNYLTQRSESLMALFYLLTIYGSLRALDAGDTERPALRTPATSTSRAEMRWTAIAIVACFAGMASKESMITAPLMVLLIDRILVFDSWKQALWPRRSLYAGLAASWVVLGAILWTVPRTSAGFTSLSTSWNYLLNQAQIVPRYLALALWPRSLVLDYGLPVPLTFGQVWLGFTFLAVLGALTIVVLWRWPKIGLLCAWFFITLAPASSIIPVATEVGAERRMYLPLMALVLLAVLGVHTWLEKRAGANRRSVAIGLVAVISLLMIVGLQLRNREYSSPMTMAQTIVQRWPNGRGHFLFASELIGAGRHDEAMAEFRESAKTYPGALFALGTELAGMGQLDEAARDLEDFIKAQPGNPVVIPARELLSTMYLSQGKVDQAGDHLRQLLARVPNHAGARRMMGELKLKLNDPAGAVTEYQAALRVQPNHPEAMLNLGFALAALNRFDESATVLRELVVLTPQDPGPHLLLGRVLAVLKKFDEAESEFKTAVQLDPENRDARTNLESLQRMLGRTVAVPAGGQQK